MLAGCSTASAKHSNTKSACANRPKEKKVLHGTSPPFHPLNSCVSPSFLCPPFLISSRRVPVGPCCGHKCLLNMSPGLCGGGGGGALPFTLCPSLRPVQLLMGLTSLTADRRSISAGAQGSPCPAPCLPRYMRMSVQTREKVPLPGSP